MAAYRFTPAKQQRSQNTQRNIMDTAHDCLQSTFLSFSLIFEHLYRKELCDYISLLHDGNAPPKRHRTTVSTLLTSWLRH